MDFLAKYEKYFYVLYHWFDFLSNDFDSTRLSIILSSKLIFKQDPTIIKSRQRLINDNYENTVLLRATILRYWLLQEKASI